MGMQVGLKGGKRAWYRVLRSVEEKMWVDGGGDSGIVVRRRCVPEGV